MVPRIPFRDRHLIVGREQDREMLRACLASAFDGCGALALLSGETGIGKSTLVRDLLDEARAREATVLAGGCYDLTMTPPYGPWTDALGMYAPSQGLPQTVPALLPGSDGNVESQASLFASVRDFFFACSTIRPVVLVLEDLHWSDEASLELLRFQARQIAQIPMLIVVTYRDDELSRNHRLFQILPSLARETEAARIELRPLGRAAVSELVAQRGLAGEDAIRLVDYLERRADGNPLFITELLRALETDGTLEACDGHARLAELDDGYLPPFVLQVIERRLATLDADARRALEIAAVIGHEVPLDIWQAVGSVDPDILSGSIERALEIHLLEATADRQALRFSHSLIREALYSGLNPTERRAWHRQIGEVCETTLADPDIIAYHYQQAGNRRAVDWLIKAANRARRAYAHAVAAERLEAALRMFGDDPGTDRQRAWLAWRASRMSAYADQGKQREYVEMAQQLAHQAGDAGLVALCSMDLGIWHCGNGEGRRGIRELARGGELWKALGDEQRIATTADALADGILFPFNATLLADRGLIRRLSGIYPGQGPLSAWLAYLGRFRASLSSAENFLADVDVAGLPPELHRLVCRGGSAALAVSHAALGNAEVSRRMYEVVHENNRLMSAHVPRVFSAGMHFWFLNLPYYTDDLAERQALQAIAADALPRIDRAFPSMVSGMPWFEIVAGNWREAKELLYAYLNRPVGWGWRLPFLSLACWLERHTGNPQLAWSRVHECLPAGPRTEPGDEQFMFITPLIRRAVELALDDGDSERARPWLEAHDRWLRWSGAVTGQAQSHLLWGRYWQQSGNAQDARQEAGLALDAALDPRQPLQLIAAYRFLGELDVSERLFDAAEGRLAQALELADACALPYERARCLLALARLHAARNDSAALALIENVHTICKPLDAMPILAEADNLERELLRGIQRPAGLSAREMEVLRLIAEGLSDAQIATQLSISPRTVNRHTTSIYNKLGINSRVAATRFAIERQLL